MLFQAALSTTGSLTQGGGWGHSARMLGLTCDSLSEIQLIGSNGRIFNSEADGMGIFLRGFFFGNPWETQASIQPFLDIPGASVILQAVNFWEATQIDAAFYTDSEKFAFAGRFVYGDFNEEKIDRILNLVKVRAEGSYVNFPFLCTENYRYAYYGKNAERLLQVKQKYDPCNLFRYPQSI